MYVYSLLGEYTFAAVAGIICITLIIIQGREKFKTKKVYISTVIFVINILAISILLCGVYSREAIFNNSNVATAIRALDYFFYIALLYTWLCLLISLCKEIHDFSLSVWFIMGKATCFTCMVLFVATAIFFLDSTYYTSSIFMQNFYYGLEVVFALLSTLFIIIGMFKVLEFIVVSSTRKYVIANSVAVSVYFLMQIWLALDLVNQRNSMPHWEMGRIEPSGWALFVINLLNIYFIYVTDFQPLFKASNNDGKIVNELASNFDLVAEAHNLTHREREIIELVYHGASNAKIAETLFISLNTVKSHMKNIFEKLGVSTRMELTYIINKQTYNQ